MIIQNADRRLTLQTVAFEGLSALLHLLAACSASAKVLWWKRCDAIGITLLEPQFSKQGHALYAGRNAAKEM